MDRAERRAQALARIKANIERAGRHLYLVSGGQSPRFGYTIGVSETAGSELILAGGELFTGEEVRRILNALGARSERELVTGAELPVEGLGRFRLGPVDASWRDELLLGALDYYEREDVPALQVLPEAARRTVDVPDLSRPFTSGTEPVWRYLSQPWDRPLPEASTAVTNLAALRGQPVTEAARWEEDEWEAFHGAGPDVPREEVRVVPLWVLLGSDPTLAPLTELAVGEALRREPGQEWKPWGS